MSRTDIDDIFNDALELERGQREQFLIDACSGDAALLQKVTELLKVADQASQTWLTTIRDQYQTRGPNSSSELARRMMGSPPCLGRYDVLEWIDEGGMGAVYRAHHRRLDKVVAIKFLLQDHGADTEWLNRFEEEARLLARLDHPNIARVYDFDQERDVPFLVMEFVEGTTLEQILQQRPENGPRGSRDDVKSRTDWTVDACRQIAQAVHHAHSHRVVHLDLKPANVMITEDGVVKVLDFGIARTFLQAGSEAVAGEGENKNLPMDLANSAGESISEGTPQFMSPEQRRNEQVGPASDIWSLGCILFDCLVDSIPRGAAARAERDPNRLPPEIPAEIRRVVASCLNENPDSRPASADWVVSALSPPDRRKAGSRRRFYLGGFLSLVIVVAATLIFFFGEQSPGPVAIEQVQEDVIHALGPDGQVLWIRRMPARVLVNQRRNGFRTMEPVPPTIIQQEGNAIGILVATAPGTAPGKLWLLDPGSGETIWSHEPGWTAPVNDIGHPLYAWTEYIRWPGESAPVILACIGVNPWYPSALEVISLGGETLGVYHHPGPLWLEAQADFNNDGNETLLFSAINSSGRFDRRLAPTGTDQHLGCLLILDPNDFGGQGWPYTKGLPDERDWPGLEPAHEVAYLAIPFIHPDVASHGLVVDIGIQDGQTTIRAETRDGRMFFMNDTLRPRVYHVEPDGVAGEYRDAGRATFLPLLYRHGGQEELVDVPLIQ